MSEEKVSVETEQEKQEAAATKSSAAGKDGLTGFVPWDAFRRILTETETRLRKEFQHELGAEAEKAIEVEESLRDRIREQSTALQNHLEFDSKAHSDLSERLQVVEEGLQEVQRKVEDLVTTWDEQVQRLTMLATHAKNLTEDVRATAVDLKEKFPQRLDALGTQVASLVSLGGRVAETEKRAGALEKLTDNLASGIVGLESTLDELQNMAQELTARGTEKSGGTAKTEKAPA